MQLEAQMRYMNQEIGKYLIIIGILIVGVGLALTFWGKIPFFGKLPGDIKIEKENFTFYFPVVTSIILSILLSLIFFVINYFRK
jgi:NAD/NADP transhydrogenase beta subunit